ncbi:MAG: NAD(P)-dependent oxidoreductase, partial [Planctomycetia bacterium]
MGTVLAADVDALLARTPSLWDPLRGASLFISGGTGFFGTWLLETLVAAERRFSLDCRATVL